jgi:hypothetical protein
MEVAAVLNLDEGTLGFEMRNRRGGGLGRRMGEPVRLEKVEFLGDGEFFNLPDYQIHAGIPRQF